MQAVIMAGGFGTRLRPLTCNIPKPMVPLMNRPVIEHIVRYLKNHNFDEVFVMLFFQPEIIKKHLGDGSRFGVSITYLQPEDDLGTAGCVKYAEKYLRDTFLVISGDLCTDVNLTAFYDFHKSRKSDATILLTKVANPLPFGIVMTDKNHNITRFLEKPSWGEVFSNTINTGIYMFEPSILKRIPEDSAFDFGKDLFPMIHKDETKFLGYPATGYWKDIGNLEEYLLVQLDCLSDKVDKSFCANFSKSKIPRSAQISKNAQMKGDIIIGKEVEVADDAYIENSILGDGTVVEKGARVINSTLWDNVAVGAASQIKNSVIASNTKLGRASVISDKTFIGEDVFIGDRSLVKSQVKIWPKKVVASDTILSTSLVWGDTWLKELFTESKISGIDNIEMTPEFAARLGSALGAFWGVDSQIYTSRDNGRSSHMILDAVHSGLNSMGVDIQCKQVAPIPVTRHLLRSSNFNGGLHVRKSPYHDQKTDIIIVDSKGIDLHPNKCKKIERLFFGEDYVRIQSSHIGFREFTNIPIETYRKNFMAAVNKEAIQKKKLKVIIDFSHGPSGALFPSLFNDLDIDLITLNANVNPEFLSINAKKRKEQVKQLSAIVKSLGADVGFIVNPTTERLFIVDDLGRYFANIDLLAIVTKLYLDQYSPAKIGAPVIAPLIIKKLAEENDVEYISCKSTHQSMIETASMDGMGFVGGTKGGFIFTNFSFASDALYATVKIMELMANNKAPISDIIDTIELPKIVLKHLPCSWDQKGKIMNEMMKETEGLNRELIHGIKIYEKNDSWILLLPAKEEELFSVVTEAPTKKKAAEYNEIWCAKVKAHLTY